MPDTLLDGTPLLAGAARIPSAGFFWPNPGAGSAMARRKLSLATCNGCHAAETAAEIFHLDPRVDPWNVYAQSTFLRERLQVPDPDPAGKASLGPFDEREHRATALNRLAPRWRWRRGCRRRGP
jgi:hypothetical protein